MIHSVSLKNLRPELPKGDRPDQTTFTAIPGGKLSKRDSEDLAGLAVS